MQISKGIKSKEELLEQARLLFNEEGLTITLSELAKKMNTTLGRITYHFPTKDDLIIALAHQYQDLQLKIRGSATGANLDFQKFIERASAVMDIQYHFRCVIKYISTSVKAQNKVFSHTESQFRNNREVIFGTFKALVNNGSLTDEILTPDNFNVVLFTFTNLFTTWVINLEIYDSDKSYEEMKPVYLNGIFSCFIPYLTDSGRSEFIQLGIT